MLMRAMLFCALAAWLALGHASESFARSSPILVYFQHDSDELDPRALAVLGCAADAMAETSLIVSAHADRSGPADYNLRFSRRRAMAVRAELIRLGFRPEHVTTRAFGETRLAVETPDGVSEPFNRYAWIYVDGYVGPRSDRPPRCRAPTNREEAGDQGSQG